MSSTVLAMQEELASVGWKQDDTTADPASSAALGEPEACGADASGCDVLDLRMELDLAQLDHPSRWAKLCR